MRWLSLNDKRLLTFFILQKSKTVMQIESDRIIIRELELSDDTAYIEMALDGTLYYVR